MPETTLTINHAGGGSETYTINRDKFEGIRTMTRKLSETAGDPENITRFDVAITPNQPEDEPLSGTYQKTSETIWEHTTEAVRIEKSSLGSYWFIYDYAYGGQVERSINYPDYPWDLEFSGGSITSFVPSNFVGGSIGSLVTDTVSVDHTPPEDLRNLLIDAENITINRDKGEEFRTLFIDGVEVTIDRTGEVIVEGFLTLFPNAAAAYSLQRLNGHHALINARRGSDNVEVDVYPDNSANREVSADSPITVTSGSSSATTFGEFINQTSTTLPADKSEAAAAYSLRKVKANFTGSAINARRGSDGVEVDVAFDGNDEVSADSPITATSGSSSATTFGEFLAEGGSHDAFVTTWYDQAGSNDATQPLDDAQPKIAENGSLLADGIDFDGSDDVLIGSHNITSDYSFFTVTNDTGSSTSYIADTGSHGGNGVNFGRRVNSSGNRQLTLNHGGSSAVNASGFLVGESLISQTYDSTTISTSVNGVSVGTANRVYTASGTTLTVGANSEFIAHFNGTMKEIIVFNSDQSANRADIEANIATHYGISIPKPDVFVTTWYDQAGSNDASQPLDDAQPKIAEGGSVLAEGSNPAIEFDGVDTYLQTGAVGTSSDFPASTFAVFNRGRTSDSVVRTLISTGNRGAFGNASLAYTWHDTYFSNYVSVANTAIPANQQIVASGFGVSNSNSLDGGIIIGGDIPGYTSLDGTLQEFIVYTSDQSANREAIEAHINERYSIY